MNRHREILDTTKCTNISIMGLSEGEGTEKILKEIMAENYQTMMKNINLYIQETLQTL